MGAILQSICDFFVGSSQKQLPHVGAESVQVPVTSEEDSLTGRLSNMEAPDGKEFYVHDGPTVSTVGDLADALRQAPKDTFRHHIRKHRNDFADWVRNVFEDDPSASVIEGARNPSEVVYILDTLSQ